MTVGAMPFFLMLRRFRLRLEFLSPYAQLLSDRIGSGTCHQHTRLLRYPPEEFCVHLPTASLR